MGVNRLLGYNAGCIPDKVWKPLDSDVKIPMDSSDLRRYLRKFNPALSYVIEVIKDEFSLNDYEPTVDLLEVKDVETIGFMGWTVRYNLRIDFWKEIPERVKKKLRDSGHIVNESAIDDDDGFTRYDYMIYRKREIRGNE